MSRMDEETIRRYKEDHCCGACRHWHRWTMERERERWNDPDRGEDRLHFGDCDRIPKGTVVTSKVEEYTYTYDGYSFEDECYDEDMQCYEES